MANTAELGRGDQELRELSKEAKEALGSAIIIEMRIGQLEGKKLRKGERISGLVVEGGVDQVDQVWQVRKSLGSANEKNDNTRLNKIELTNDARSLGGLYRSLVILSTAEGVQSANLLSSQEGPGGRANVDKTVSDFENPELISKSAQEIIKGLKSIIIEREEEVD